jgi:hypothetical protein
VQVAVNLDLGEAERGGFRLLPALGQPDLGIGAGRNGDLAVHLHVTRHVGVEHVTHAVLVDGDLLVQLHWNRGAGRNLDPGRHYRPRHRDRRLGEGIAVLRPALRSGGPANHHAGSNERGGNCESHLHRILLF